MVARVAPHPSISREVATVHWISPFQYIGSTLAHLLAVAKVQFLLDSAKQKEAIALCTDLSQCERVTIKVKYRCFGCWNYCCMHAQYFMLHAQYFILHAAHKWLERVFMVEFVSLHVVRTRRKCCERWRPAASVPRRQTRPRSIPSGRPATSGSLTP